MLPVWEFGGRLVVKIPPPSGSDQQEEGPEAAQAAEGRCLATWETLLQTH